MKDQSYTNSKALLNLAATVSILVVAYAAWSYSRDFGQSIDPSSIRSFSVSAEGGVVTVPDIATFTVGVISAGDGNNLESIQEDNTNKANKIIDFLKSNRVDSKDIKTTQFNISPRYESIRCSYTPGSVCPPAKIVGYTVTQTVTVKIRDFDKIGDILGGLTDKGANAVSGLSFGIDDPKNAESEAREKAIEEAEEKAKDVAKSAGFRIGKLLGISESGTRPPMYYARATVESLDTGFDGSAPSIEAGSQEVKVNVTLTYEIK